MNAKSEDLIDNLVSIVMPAYNCQDTVLDSINSVIDQTYTNFELIVVDDGSNDNTYKVLKKFQNCTKILVLRSKINCGISFSRNIAISKARGQYIAFLDTDDTWHKDKLKIQVNVMKNNNFFCCHSSYTRKDKNQKKGKLIKAQKFVRNSDMLKGNKIANLTGIYDAKKLGKVFQKKIGHEDYLMWIQIVNLAGFSYGCLSNLASYNFSKKGVSSNKLKAIFWTWNIYRNELKMSLFSSFISLIKYFLFVLNR